MHTLLNSLRPDPPAGSSLSRPRVTVAAKDFEEAATEREKWFDVHYQAGFSVVILVVQSCMRQTDSPALYEAPALCNV